MAADGHWVSLGGDENVPKLVLDEHPALNRLKATGL